MAEAEANWEAKLALNGVAPCRSVSDTSIRVRLPGRLSPSNKAQSGSVQNCGARDCKRTAVTDSPELVDTSADRGMRARTNRWTRETQCDLQI